MLIKCFQRHTYEKTHKRHKARTQILCKAWCIFMCCFIFSHKQYSIGMADTGWNSALIKFSSKIIN